MSVPQQDANVTYPSSTVAPSSMKSNFNIEGEEELGGVCRKGDLLAARSVDGGGAVGTGDTGRSGPTRKVVCCPLSKCCRVVLCNKKSEPKLMGDDAWCDKNRQQHPADGATTEIEDLVPVSPRGENAPKVGQKRTRDAATLDTPVQTAATADVADPGNGFVEGGSVTPCTGAPLPELTKGDFKRFADEIALVLVGSTCMPKVVCPLLFEAWTEYTETMEGGESEPPLATVRAVATTESNIKKVQKGTAVYGEIPFILVIDSQNDAVYKLDLTGWNIPLLKACPRYRAARVCECMQFLQGCKTGTWPKAPRGKPRPENDIISTYSSLKWAVQCSFAQLVHDQVLGLSEGCEQRFLGDAFGVSWSTVQGKSGSLNDGQSASTTAQPPSGRVIRPKDVVVLFWHQECPSCGPTLQLLNDMMAGMVAKLTERIPCLDTPEKATAWCPLSIVCCNVSDNDLGPDWIVDRTTSVPAIRLYPADCLLMTQDAIGGGKTICLEDQSDTDVESTPKPSAMDGSSNTAASDARRLSAANSATPSRTFSTFKGVRSKENIQQFIKEHCKSPDTAQMMTCGEEQHCDRYTCPSVE